jgi:hypothetical protein
LLASAATDARHKARRFFAVTLNAVVINFFDIIIMANEFLERPDTLLIIYKRGIFKISNGTDNGQPHVDGLDLIPTAPHFTYHPSDPSGKLTSIHISV